MVEWAKGGRGDEDRLLLISCGSNQSPLSKSDSELRTQNSEL